MADAYWRYSNDGRLQQPIPTQLAKRPRPDYEIASGQGISTFYGGREDNPSAAAHGVIRDTDTINASYDRYLRNSQQQQHQHQPIPSYGMESGRSMSTGLAHDDPRLLSNTVMATKTAVAGGHRENRLPPDATCTLYVEGLPANCTRREVAHIFRPFVGYKEVRLVTKESRRPGGDSLVLCFVDFQSPAHAATAMDAIQGYTVVNGYTSTTSMQKRQNRKLSFDEHERESAHLRLQFARNSGARSGPRSRSKR